MSKLHRNSNHFEPPRDPWGEGRIGEHREPRRRHVHTGKVAFVALVLTFVATVAYVVGTITHAQAAGYIFGGAATAAAVLWLFVIAVIRRRRRRGIY